MYVVEEFVYILWVLMDVEWRACSCPFIYEPFVRNSLTDLNKIWYRGSTLKYEANLASFLSVIYKPNFARNTNQNLSIPSKTAHVRSTILTSMGSTISS
jgi:hypothetical protein